ncbi:uncharacterized protein LOC144662076 isoform X2 [Oculina patagonica]
MIDVQRLNGYRCNQHPCQSTLQIHRNQDSSPRRQHADTEGFVRGGQQLLPRMNLSPFSSTVGLACGSSPFNDASLPSVNNSPIHPNWMPHNPHHPCFRGALNNTKWPVAQPVFLPVERSDVHFHRGCHHHPPPCHMSVYNCCTHVSHCGYSTFPKRPRHEGDQLLPMPENGPTKSAFKASWQTSQAYQTMPEDGITKSAFKASWQTSQAYQTALRRPRSPPPLVKTSQNGCHHRTSEVPHSGTETRKASHVRSTSVTASKNVSSTHSNSSVNDSIKYGEEAYGSHSTTLRDSYKAMNKDNEQCSSTTSFGSTRRGYSSVADKKRSANSEDHRKVDNENEKCNTSPHNNNQKDAPVSLNNLKKECSGKRKCKQSNRTDTRKESYSIRSEEQPEHFTSFEARDAASRCRTTKEQVEQECQKHSFAKPKEDIFVSRDGNQNGTHLSCDANVRQYTSLCMYLPQSSPDIPTRRQSMPQHRHSPRDNKEEFPVKIRGSFYEREANEENKKCPAISPTEYQKCSTGLFKHSYQNKQFTPVPGGKIASNYPTSDHQRCDNSPFNSQAPHFGLQSKVPQLRRGRPRTKGLKDNTSMYNGVPAYSPTDRQSHLSMSISCDTPQCKHSMRNSDGDVFSVSSASDINNNSTTATDKMRYQPFVPNDTSTRSVNNFENEHQIRRQAEDQPRKTMSIVEPHNQNRNTNIASHDQKYQQTHNINRNRDHVVSSTQHQDRSLNHCQKPPSLLPVETSNVSTSCHTLKRKSPSAPSRDSTKFVTNLNELLKRRNASCQRQHGSNNFSFDETQRQDATQLRNQPVGTPSSHCQEERQGSTICQSTWNAKPFEGHQKPTNLEEDKNRRKDTTGFPNEKPEVQSSHRHVAKEEPGRSVALRLSRPNCEEINSRDYKVMTSTSSGNQESYIVENNVKTVLNDQATDTSKEQPCCPSSCPVPLPSAEDELDNIDGGCGGYAIDHSSLPKIVAVHSIVKRDETVREDEPTLFSANDKKYWKGLLKKLTSELCDFRGEIEPHHSKPEMNTRVSASSTLVGLLEEGKIADAQKQNKAPPEDGNVTITSKKDSSVQPENLNEAKMDDNISQWTMWDYLSTPSTNLTVHVRNPTSYTETEKKTQLPRKKLTVAELCEKILGTRERIKNETIPWKKKLLHSLEAIFIKRLRKTEKETGQKADISFEEEKVKEDPKEKKNGQKERRYSQGGKEKIVGPRHKQTTKKKL